MRGKAGHVPFWPGGLDEILLSDSAAAASSSKELRRIPPGFSRGLRFGDEDPFEEDPDSLDIDEQPRLKDNLEVGLDNVDCIAADLNRAGRYDNRRLRGSRRNLEYARLF